MTTQSNTESIISENLNENLLKVGFEKVDFEPVVQNRFIVKTDDIPSHLIKSVVMPFYHNSDIGPEWSILKLYIYNPVNVQLEKSLVKVLKKKKMVLQVLYLSPIGEVITTWNIDADVDSIDFGKFDWSNTGDPNIISVCLDVKKVEIE